MLPMIILMGIIIISIITITIIIITANTATIIIFVIIIIIEFGVYVYCKFASKWQRVAAYVFVSV